MVHCRVGRDADAEDAGHGDPGRLAHRGHERQERLFEDRVLQTLRAAGLLLLNDAVDDVRAVADLAVAGGGLGCERAGLQIHQNASDGRGADIDGAAVDGSVLLFRDVQNGQHTVGQRAGDENGEVCFAQRLRELFDRMIGELHVRTAVERVLRKVRETLGVGHGVVERRLVEREDGLHKVVCKVDARGLHILLQLVEDRDLLAGGEVCRLHAALVGGGNVRDHDDDVSRGLRRTAQAPACGVILIGDMAGLYAGDLAGDELHAALAAGAVAVAGCVDGDVGRLCSFENGAAGCGGEFDLLCAVFKLEGDFVHVICSFRITCCTAAGGIRGRAYRRPPAGP